MEDCLSQSSGVELSSLSSFTITWFLTSLFPLLSWVSIKYFVTSWLYSLFSSCFYFTFAAINPDKTLVWSSKSDSWVSGSVHAVFLAASFSFLLCLYLFLMFSFFLAPFFPSFHFFFQLFHVTFPCTCTTWAKQSRAVNSWDILGGKNIVIFEVTSTLQRQM